MLKHLLVPLDGSATAARAIPYAQDVIAPNGQITLITVIDVPERATAMFYPAGIGAYEISYEAIKEQAAPQAKEYLEGIARGLRDAGLQVVTQTAIGDPAATIVDEANNLGVDAIVMSTHGRSGISRWLFGSVAQKVLTCTQCPVMIVPDKKC